jgi:hypothetical protein
VNKNGEHRKNDVAYREDCGKHLALVGHDRNGHGNLVAEEKLTGVRL